MYLTLSDSAETDLDNNFSLSKDTLRKGILVSVLKAYCMTRYGIIKVQRLICCFVSCAFELVSAAQPWYAWAVM